MHRWIYPVLLFLLVLFLLFCTVGSACLIGWLGGKTALAVFLLFPALAMLSRAIGRREPRPWLWFLFGGAWAPLVWLALPVAVWMTLRPPGPEKQLPKQTP
jgi:hypothetical protein